MSSKSRGSTRRRKLRSIGGTLLRRLGLLPGGMPDGLGDDASLAGRPLEEEIVVFFADTPDGLYQLRQWYGPFEALAAERKLLVVASDSRTARAVRSETSFRVVTVAHYATLDGMLDGSSTRLALYVNHNPLNFSMLRFTSVMHVSLLHGDSDKVVSVSHQTKAYDRSFVAGTAAVDRLARYVPHLDSNEHCVEVGRPQLDAPASIEARRPRLRSAADPITVLYAPTWEGAQPSAAYGSLAAQGPRIARALVAADGVRLLYRPHPLTGVRSAAYGDADAEVRQIIESANHVGHGSPHEVASGGSIEQAFGGADILVCDVSAVAMDWLPTGRPLIVTEPAGGVVTARSPILEACARLGADDADEVARTVLYQVREDPFRDRRLRMTEYYLGDITPGAATRRFLDACGAMIAEHDGELRRLTLRGPASAGSGTAPV
ncbi:CDP-glycerol glycerophosphotransferase family protein [Cellulomonas sp. PhB143]|uniref:CDP-glycerol glycerophosphotransferase family protein n=1 Tax=Cellulomonas sp. PhB143 TaxID=2485186 RepID=UPI000F488BEA|nr:CDP-glycerol glycerophosphotransferase family protein [Cellulomonas sp. PhB143]ROS78559.1 CDP-glycerol glycerophosphotransferase (TagB/SpsB family) [Cellulomonas sp. PhB143]